MWSHSQYRLLLLLLLLSSSSSSSSPLCRVFTIIYLKKHVSRVYSVAAVLYLQFVRYVMLFCPWNTFCTFTLSLSVVCVQRPLWLFFIVYYYYYYYYMSLMFLPRIILDDSLDGRGWVKGRHSVPRRATWPQNQDSPLPTTTIAHSYQLLFFLLTGICSGWYTGRLHPGDQFLYDFKLFRTGENLYYFPRSKVTGFLFCSSVLGRLCFKRT